MTSTIASRMSGATFLGACTTALVLLLMQSMIASDQVSLDEPAVGATLTFLPTLKETPLPPRQPPPDPPPKPIDPPPPPMPTIEEAGGPTIGPDFRPPPIDPGRHVVPGPMADGDALAVVKVRPVYPARAQERGIEGYVLVEFTIDSLGRVVEPRVIEAEPRGVFERAALKAVERFRYKPRVVNGEPTEVTGVRHLITFELDARA